jgi:hypothetical protein
MSDYTAHCINDCIAALTDKPLSVYWDGEIVNTANPARYNVLADEQDTDFYVIDDRAFLTLYESKDRNHVDEIDTLRNYAKLAELIVDVVPIPMEEEA